RYATDRRRRRSDQAVVDEPIAVVVGAVADLRAGRDARDARAVLQRVAGLAAELLARAGVAREVGVHAAGDAVRAARAAVPHVTLPIEPFVGEAVAIVVDAVAELGAAVTRAARLAAAVGLTVEIRVPRRARADGALARAAARDRERQYAAV